ncbi:MAG TPA: signal peptidase I [Candidatus Acidoferrales bacterium]|nr:signal peptidase I [Candidatus Acidoferrales bacterium]
MEADSSIPQPADVSVGVPERAKSVPKRSTFAEYAESLLVTVLLALFGTTFIVQAFKIPSQSMEPTLLVGDHLLVNKFIFEGNGTWYEKLLPYRAIQRGDIVVFKFPFDDHPHYVKRVVGLPGDRVRIINQHVYVNGDPLSEPYVVHDTAYEDPFGDNFPPANRYFVEIGLRPEWAEQILSHVHGGELVVPPGNYFVMGDNRDRSWDSRYWGFVDRRAIMGRPIMVYWSVEATSEDYVNRGFLGSLRAIGQNLLHLPSRTRWHRMMHEVH